MAGILTRLKHSCMEAWIWVEERREEVLKVMTSEEQRRNTEDRSAAVSF